MYDFINLTIHYLYPIHYEMSYLPVKSYTKVNHNDGSDSQKDEKSTFQHILVLFHECHRIHWWGVIRWTAVSRHSRIHSYIFLIWQTWHRGFKTIFSLKWVFWDNQTKNLTDHQATEYHPFVFHSHLHLKVILVLCGLHFSCNTDVRLLCVGHFLFSMPWQYTATYDATTLQSTNEARHDGIMNS